MIENSNPNTPLEQTKERFRETFTADDNEKRKVQSIAEQVSSYLKAQQKDDEFSSLFTKRSKVVEPETWEIPECEDCGFVNCQRCDKPHEKLRIHYCEECRMELLMAQGRKNPDKEDIANLAFRCLNKIEKESEDEEQEEMGDLDGDTAPATAV